MRAAGLACAFSRAKRHFPLVVPLVGHMRPPAWDSARLARPDSINDKLSRDGNPREKPSPARVARREPRKKVPRLRNDRLKPRTEMSDACA